MSDSGPRTIPGVGLLTTVLDGFTGAVNLPLRVVTGSVAGQRALGIANGVFGENAGPRGGTLPAAMTVRVDGVPIPRTRAALAAAFPGATGRVAVFVHGLVDTERSWFAVPDRSFGNRLGEDLPATAVHLRYNTGRRVNDNGGELAGLLTELAGNWPVPVTEFVLVGHSMGGLVARSAVLQAHERGLDWVRRPCRLVCLGTPHTGAQLEQAVVRVGAFLDRFGLTAPLGRLLALRSDGIKDLARGHVPPGRERALPPGVRQCFVAVTLARSENSVLARLVGDLLVTPASAGTASRAPTGAGSVACTTSTSSATTPSTTPCSTGCGPDPGHWSGPGAVGDPHGLTFFPVRHVGGRAPEAQRRTGRPLAARETCRFAGVRSGDWPRAWSEDRDAGGLRALLTLAHVELDALVLLERLEAATRDLRVVHEDVGRAVVGGDETEALFGVEPLHDALSHIFSSTDDDADRHRGEPGCLRRDRFDHLEKRTPATRFASAQRHEHKTNDHHQATRSPRPRIPATPAAPRHRVRPARTGTERPRPGTPGPPRCGARPTHIGLNVASRCTECPKMVQPLQIPKRVRIVALPVSVPETGWTRRSWK